MLQLLTIALLLAVSLSGAQQPAAKKPAQKAQEDGVVYLTAAQLEETANKAGVRAVDRKNYAVIFAKRSTPGEAELHENETDIYYVVEGKATLITGGAIEGSKTTAPGQVRGTAIRGGQTHRLSKGDSVVIPKQTPHWLSAVNGPMKYFVVKVVE